MGLHETRLTHTKSNTRIFPPEHLLHFIPETTAFNARFHRLLPLYYQLSAFISCTHHHCIVIIMSRETWCHHHHRLNIILNRFYYNKHLFRLPDSLFFLLSSSYYILTLNLLYCLTNILIYIASYDFINLFS